MYGMSVRSQVEISMVCSRASTSCWHYLDSIEIQLSFIGPAGNAGSCATTQADAIGRPSNLDNQPALLWGRLDQVPVINLAQAPTAAEC